MMTLFQEGSFIWIRTGEPLDFSAWYPGEPDGGDDHDCLHFNNFNENSEWSDHYCDVRSPYYTYPFKPICQRKITTFGK